MAIRIKCPSCEAVNRVDEEKRGRRVRCQECEEPIRIPAAEDNRNEDAGIQQDRRVKVSPASARSREEEDDRDDRDDRDDEDDRPRRKKKKKAKQDSTMLYLILGGVGFFVVLLMCGGGIAGFVAFRTAAPEVRRPVGPILAAERKRLPAGKNMPIVNAKGKILFETRGNLVANDPADPTPHLVEVNARMKVHQVALQAGKTYLITMNSNVIDAYLRIESPTGAKLAEDDDSGGDLNARIVFRSTQAGMHRVIATSWDGTTGPFHLVVREVD